MPTVVIIGTTVVVIVTSTASSTTRRPADCAGHACRRLFLQTARWKFCCFWREREKKSFCVSSLESSQLAEAQSATTGWGFQHLPASIF